MPKKVPTYLYSKEKPNGQYFEEDAETLKAMMDGGEWFDHPDKVPLDNAPNIDTSGLTALNANFGTVTPNSQDSRPGSAEQPNGDPVKADATALRAMFLQGKTLTTAQTKELATAMEIPFKKVGESTESIAGKIRAALDDVAWQQQSGDQQPKPQDTETGESNRGTDEIGKLHPSDEYSDIDQGVPPLNRREED